MNKFITFRDTDAKEELQYYILQREYPHYVGKVSSNPFEKSLTHSAIPGYYLWIVFSGTIRGNMMPAYRNVDVDAQSVMDSMAEWYMGERISKEEKRYKKFKIVSNVPSKS